MTALIVILILLALVLLLAQIRVGCDVEYGESGLSVRLRVGFLKFTLYPFQEKSKKKEKKKKKTQKSAKPPQPESPPKEQPETGGTLALLKETLPLVAQAGGDMKRKLRIDLLTLHLTWASSNPFAAALGYGAANAALGMFYSLLNYHFQIKESDMGVAIDFERKTPTVYLRAVLTLTIAQGVSFGIHYGIRLLSTLSQGRNNKKEAVTHE